MKRIFILAISGLTLAVGGFLAVSNVGSSATPSLSAPKVTDTGTSFDYAPHSNPNPVASTPTTTITSNPVAPPVPVPTPVSTPPTLVVPQPAPVVSPPSTTTTTVPQQTFTVTDWVIYLTWTEAGQPNLTTTLSDSESAIQSLYNYYVPLIGTSPPSAPTGYVLSAVSAPTQVSNPVTTSSASAVTTSSTTSSASDPGSTSWTVEVFVDCPGQPGQASSYYGSQAQVDSIFNQWSALYGQPDPSYPGCTYGSATDPEQVASNGTVVP